MLTVLKIKYSEVLTCVMLFDTVLLGNKKVKKNSPNTEADSSSSENSCFVAPVTVSNLHEDSLVRI